MTELVTALFLFGLEGLKKLPEWKQRKKDEYYRLLRNVTLSQEADPQDNGLVDFNVEKLNTFVSVYMKEAME